MKPLVAAVVVVGISAVHLPCSAFGAAYAPLDCAKAASSTEKTICDSCSLGQAEARMATLYGIATSLVAMGQRGDIGDAQREWLRRREACARNVACLTKAYSDRIRQLNKVIDDIAARGPY